MEPLKTEYQAHAAQGNKLFANGDFHKAIDAYTKALEMCRGQDAAVFVNRCNVYLTMRQFDKAIEDAHQALALDKTYWKAWFKLGAAFWGSEDHGHAAICFNKCNVLPAPTEELRKDAWEALQKLRIEQLFAPKCKGTKVSVVYINPSKRRGMYAKAKVQTNEVVFRERPVVCHRFEDGDAPQFPMCGYCLRSCVSDDDAVRVLLDEALVEPIRTFSAHIGYKWPAAEDPPKVLCKNCPEVYCSESCRDQCWADHHQVLCCGNNPSSDHPVIKYRKWIAEHTTDSFLRIALEVLAKICAMTLCTMRRTQGDRTLAWDLFTPYQDKKSPLLPHPKWKAVTNLLQGICRDEQYDIRLTEEFLYTKLGQLALNLQVVEPPAMTHNVMVPIPTGMEKGPWGAKLSAYPKVPYKASTEQRPKGDDDSDEDEDDPKGHGEGVWMTSLGTEEKPLCVGLYLLQSSINHDCAPSVVLESQENAEIAVTATHDMDMGTEIASSYVDMDLSFSERQHKLQWYEFTCDCDRCKEERDLEELEEKLRLQRLEAADIVELD